MTNPEIARIFRIIAVMIFVVAAYFIYQENVDGIFISVVFGSVAFLLSSRFESKEKILRHDQERRLAQETALNELSEDEDEIQENPTNG